MYRWEGSAREDCWRDYVTGRPVESLPTTMDERTLAEVVARREDAKVEIMSANAPLC